MKFLDIFSGIGGFRRAFELAGHTCAGHVEIDRHADMAYRAIHKVKESEFFCRDIGMLRPAMLPGSDIWCFGFPCVDISVAGKRAGMDGKRSGLYYSVIELVRGMPEEDRPRWLIAENVRNLLAINGGWDFASVLSAMANAGYAVQWAVYNTKDFGLPQNRERVFIAGSSVRHFGTGPPPPVFYQPGENPAHIGKLAGEKQGNRIYDADGLAVTIMAGGKNGMYAVRPRAVTTPERTTPRGGKWIMKKPDDAMFTLTTIDRHGLMLGGQIRRLTSRECFRLQGFTDEDYERAAAVCSETQLYKQAGNSVSVPVVYAIAKNLEEQSHAGF